MHGLRRNDGFALPVALAMLTIIGLLVVATVGFATHNTDRATRDLRAARALAAADAGIDAALYRMNKAVIGSQVKGALGVITTVTEMARDRCLSVSLGQLTLPAASNGWCPATTSTEDVDGAAAAGESWVPSKFTYSVSTGVNIGTAPDDPNAQLIERKVVSIGTVDDVSKRVRATAHLRLSPSGNLLRVFEQVGYKQCASAIPSGTNAAANC